MRLRPFIGVVGTLPIAPSNVNRNIGTRNTRKCAEERDRKNKNVKNTKLDEEENKKTN